MTTKFREYVGWFALAVAIMALVLVSFRTVKLPEADTDYFGAIGNIQAENYIPYVRYNQGYYSDYDIETTANLVVGEHTTLGGGQLRSKTIATSTLVTTYTFEVADLLNYDTISFTPNMGATTLTFMASSSATTLVPVAGDMQETCFYNATSTATATLTFAAGTGIDWEIATSTIGVVGTPAVIAADGFGCFKFIRKPATASAFDIGVLYTPYINAD